MNFYGEWKENIHNLQHIDAFLSKDSETIAEFYDEQNNVQKDIVAAILKADVNELIARIIELRQDYVIASNQVPQFSSFEMGTKKICEILSFSPDGLSFTDLGYKLCKASNYYASIKYGENHAKLAKTLHLVYINKSKDSIVKISPFGQEILRITGGKEKLVFQKLLLREDLIKTLIVRGVKGKVSYRKVVNSLSETTAVRRRTNTKCFLSMAVFGTEYEYIFNNVIW